MSSTFVFANPHKEEWNVRVIKKKDKAGRGEVAIVPPSKQPPKHSTDYYWYLNCEDPEHFQTLLGTRLTDLGRHITRDDITSQVKEAAACASGGGGGGAPRASEEAAACASGGAPRASEEAVAVSKTERMIEFAGYTLEVDGGRLRTLMAELDQCKQDIAHAAADFENGTASVAEFESKQNQILLLFQEAATRLEELHWRGAELAKAVASGGWQAFDANLETVLKHFVETGILLPLGILNPKVVESARAYSKTGLQHQKVERMRATSFPSFLQIDRFDYSDRAGSLDIEIVLYKPDGGYYRVNENLFREFEDDVEFRRRQILAVEAKDRSFVEETSTAARHRVDDPSFEWHHSQRGQVLQDGIDNWASQCLANVLKNPAKMVIGTALFDLCPGILQPAVSQAHPCFQAKLPRPVYLPRGNLDLDKGLYLKEPQDMPGVEVVAQDAKASDVIKAALVAGWNAMMAYRRRAFRKHQKECWPATRGDKEFEAWSQACKQFIADNKDCAKANADGSYHKTFATWEDKINSLSP